MAKTSAALRRQEEHEFKRGRILDAAREIFAAEGLSGASVRGIAKAAGYTPGALYAYYASKEDIYGDLLKGSLGSLLGAVRDAAAGERAPVEKARAGFRAFYRHYRDHRDELSMGLYLFSPGGAQRRGLSRDLDRQLNGRLIAVLQALAADLQGAGIGKGEAQAVTMDLLCHIIGVLVLDATGRLDILGAAADDLVERRLEQAIG